MRVITRPNDRFDLHDSLNCQCVDVCNATIAYWDRHIIWHEGGGKQYLEFKLPPTLFEWAILQLPQNWEVER